MFSASLLYVEPFVHNMTGNKEEYKWKHGDYRNFNTEKSMNEKLRLCFREAGYSLVTEKSIYNNEGRTYNLSNSVVDKVGCDSLTDSALFGGLTYGDTGVEK